MDSPNSRKPGTFHWDSTLWHELSHVYVLNMTKSRVPRWFTEGLAVYEETAASPDWGDRLDPGRDRGDQDEKAAADCRYRSRIYSSDLSGASDRVVFPGAARSAISSTQKWGYDKLLAMIHDFAELKPTPEVIEKEFKMKPEEFDKQFLAWLDAQTKRHRRRIRRMEEDASRRLPKMRRRRNGMK